MMGHLSSKGPMVTVGTEACAFKAFRSHVGASNFAIEPQGEISLEVATFWASKSDPRKFYMYSGTKNLEMISDSEVDCRKWLEALEGNKQSSLEHRLIATTASKAAQQSGRQKLLLRILGSLRNSGVEQESLDDLEELVSKLEEELSAERLSKDKLKEAIQVLEDEKCQLEVAASMRQSIPGEVDASLVVDDDEEDFVREEIEFSDDDEDVVYYDANGKFDHLNLEPFDGNQDAPAKPEAKGARMRGALVRPSLVSFVKEPIPVRRKVLPPPEGPEKRASLWNIIKDMIGKDLTRISLPVYINEPLSGLRKVAEDLEYAELLHRAAAAPKGSMERMSYVCAYAISPYSSTAKRSKKPFNPLLFETFEFLCPEKGYRLFTEKVCHHPTIVAAYAEGKDWVYTSSGELRSKFWGRSLELQPIGYIRIKFTDGEEFSFNKVVTSINNVIIGKLTVDHHGVMKIQSSENAWFAKIRFKDTGVLERKPHQVKGHIEDAEGKKVAALRGRWDEAVVMEVEGKEDVVLWEQAPLPEPLNSHGFTQFACQLNEIHAGLKGKLPQTDSRFRPDQALTERTLYDQVSGAARRGAGSPGGSFHGGREDTDAKLQRRTSRRTRRRSAWRRSSGRRARSTRRLGGWWSRAGSR